LLANTEKNIILDNTLTKSRLSWKIWKKVPCYVIKMNLTLLIFVTNTVCWSVFNQGVELQYFISCRLFCLKASINYAEV
jgi:hypothetical protein